MTALGNEVYIITASSDNKGSDDPYILRVSIGLSFGGGFTTFIGRKIRSFIELWLPFLALRCTRYWPLYRAAENCVKAKTFDVIIATGEPYILFGLAKRLGKRYNVPWVADYRDVWIRNPRISEKPLWIQFLTKTLYRTAERRWVASAACVLTACEYYKYLLRLTLPHPNIYAIYNGHDITFDVVRDFSEQDRPIIAYAGRLYPFQPIEKVVETLQELASERYNFELNFLGLADWPEQVSRVSACSTGIRQMVKFIPSKSYSAYIQELVNADIFIVLSHPRRKALAAKVFDYLAFNKPILLYPADGGELETLVSNHSQGHICSTPDELKSVFRKEFKALLSGKSNSLPLFSSKKEAYSRKKSTLDLVNALSECLP